MNEIARARRREHYEEELDRVQQFWLSHSLDHANGGYFSCLDREGSLYSTDKSILLTARTVWLFSRLYNKHGASRAWLDAARLGSDFLIAHLTAASHRPFLVVTEDGLGLERFFFSVEAYSAIGLAEFAVASGSQSAREASRAMRSRLAELYQPPWGDHAEYLPRSRRQRSLLPTLLYLGACQELRLLDPWDGVDLVADRLVAELLGLFRDPSTGLLHEIVGVDECLLPGPCGRMAVPGHSIHVSWLLMQEAETRERPEWLRAGIELLRKSLEIGWDGQSGGLFNCVDLEERNSPFPDWDLKLWWAHNEALYATLLAHELTREEEWETWYQRIHEYAFHHYPDCTFGGWFGYLHRDGTVATDIKGSLWKSVFHVAMSLWQCINILSRGNHGSKGE